MVDDECKPTLSVPEDLKTDRALIHYPMFVILGAALNISWIPIAGIYIQDYRNGDLQNGSALLSATVFALGLSVTLLLKMLFAQKGFKNDRHINFIELSITSLVGQVLIYLVPDAADAASTLVIFGSILTAVGTAGFILFWQCRFARLESKQQIRGVFAVVVAAIGAFLLLLYAPHIVSFLSVIIATISCGLIAFLLSLRERVGDATTTKSTDSVLFRRKMRSLHGRTCFAFFLIGFSYSLMTFLFSITSEGDILWYTWCFMFAGIIFSCFSLFVGWIRSHEFDFPFSLRIACITAIPAFFPFQAATGMTFATQFCFCSDAFSFVSIMTLGALVLIGNDRDLAPLGVSNGSFGWACFAFGIALGFPISYAVLSAEFSTLYEFIAGLVCNMFVFVFGAVLPDKETVGSLKIIESQRYPSSMATPASSSDRVVLACRELASDRHLTERETEVLCILVRGNSLAHVEKELFISEGTAITHRRNIYRKLGVHSRQELIDLLNPTNMV